MNAPKWIALAALTCTSFLYADLQSHLKKITNKSDDHKMENIDFIYMINLDHRPEKWQMSIDQLAPFDIHPYRFSAVNGWELTLDTINEIGLKFSPEMEGGFMATSFHANGDYEPSHEIIENYGQTYFCHAFARGTMGIALSHISILNDAYESGYETIWVMEDDIEIMRDPRILPELIAKLDQLVGEDHWDILFTDRDIRNAHGEYTSCFWAARRPDFKQRNDYSLRRDISSDFIQVGARYGAHSMIVRRSGIKKLLQFFKAHQLFLPYDMDYILPPGIKMYTVSQDVVTNLAKALSDNGRPYYLQKKGAN